MLRLLVPPQLGPPVNPWVGTFRAGTRISAALDLARAMLERDRVERGSIFLVSDLETAPDDIPHLTSTISDLRSADVDFRVFALSPSSDSRTLFSGLLQEDAFVVPLDLDGCRPGPQRGEKRRAQCLARPRQPPVPGARAPRAVRGASLRPATGAGAVRRVLLSREAALVAGALACLVAALVLFLLAVDVARWQSAVVGRRRPLSRPARSSGSLESADLRALPRRRAARRHLGRPRPPACGALASAVASRGSHRLRSRARAAPEHCPGATRGNRSGKRRQRPALESRRSARRARARAPRDGVAGSRRGPAERDREPPVRDRARPGQRRGEVQSRARAPARARDPPRGSVWRRNPTPGGAGAKGAGAGDPGTGY